MIKIKKGNVELKGSLGELLSETTGLHQALYELLVEKADFTEEESKEMLQETIDIAFMSELELMARALDKMLKKMEEEKNE